MAMGICTQCGETFGGVTAFDKHQKLSGEHTICINPKAVGLTRGKRGYWIMDQVIKM